MVISVPLAPRINDTASTSVMSSVVRQVSPSSQSSGTSVGQIAVIWSRGLMPARKAGVPSIGETTSMKPPWLLVISMPRPWNSPRVSTCISS